MDHQDTHLYWKNECDGWLALGNVVGASTAFRVEEVEGLVCAWWQDPMNEMESYIMIEPEYEGDFNESLHILLQQTPKSLSTKYMVVHAR